MIAHQEDAILARARERHQPLDHRARLRAPIDQITEEHKRPVRGRARGIIGGNFVEQFAEQIIAPVNIADRIDAAASGPREGSGGRNRRFAEEFR